MAAGATYEPIATQTLASAAATITFSSIAASWTDLRLVFVATSDLSASDYNVFLNVNNDTGTNYSYTVLRGNGTAASSARVTNDQKWNLINGIGITNTIPNMYQVDLFSYAGSTYKTGLETESADKNGSGWVSNKVLLWRSTAAINRIDLTTDAGVNFNTGTTATLYGIKAA